MNLSANTLFHFTPKEEYLINILEKGFLQHYCTENYEFLYAPEAERNTQKPNAGIPMTCFCDIRLSQTAYHSSKYGRFAIGLSKEWGITNNITPILYYHQNSHTSTAMDEALKKMAVLIDMAQTINVQQLEDFVKDVHGNFHSITDFFKPIEGEMVIRGNKEHVYFYDEREWRYVPPFGVEELEDIQAFLIGNSLNADFKQKEEEKLHAVHQLLFKEKDIKYIIVPNSKDIDPFINVLNTNLKSLKPELLFQKIRSYEEFELDA